MHRGMTQQKQRIEVSAGEADRRSVEVDRFAGLRLGVMFQQAVDLPIRTVGMDVQEIVVVLDHYSI